MIRSLLLDTPALEAALSPTHPHTATAVGYIRYLLEQEVPVYVSTLSLAEVGQRFALERQPLLPYLRLLAFNHTDALAASALLTRAGAALHAGIPRDTFLILAQGLAQGLEGFLTAGDTDLPHPLLRLLPPRSALRLLLLAEPHAVAFGLTGTLF